MISEVENIDNLKFMARLADKSFDLANDDPPYFTGPEKRGFYGNKQSSIGVSRVYIKTKQWELPGSYDKRFCNSLAPEADYTEKQIAYMRKRFHKYRRQIKDYEQISTNQTTIK